MPRPKSVPWQGDAAIVLLIARAPHTRVDQLEATWLALLSKALADTDSIAAAAESLSVPLRTLWDWLRRLEDDHPKLYATLPSRRPAGGPDTASVQKWVRQPRT